MVVVRNEGGASGDSGRAVSFTTNAKPYGSVGLRMKNPDNGPRYASLAWVGKPDPQADDMSVELVDGHVEYAVLVNGERLTARSRRAAEVGVKYSARCWHDSDRAHVSLRRNRPQRFKGQGFIDARGTVLAEFSIFQPVKGR